MYVQYVCPLSCRAEFHPDGEDAGPGDDERPEDTGDGRARPFLSLPADVHTGGHRRSDRRAGVLVGHQTPPHQATLQPAAPVRGGAGKMEHTVIHANRFIDASFAAALLFMCEEVTQMQY